ncbi:glycine zipper 2TM domain-containing protein [Sphingopyxis sp. MWB1]|uniref:glycine zipper 2TM domain-containing protein n=1 Tax=Sphingopyxis sp. MWB1 TaxID=1537715 RepID=UPI00051A4AD1|nr:glycine zipper 2TM domain-containing protein [Sphingopyxis sp. MWB1]
MKKITKGLRAAAMATGLTLTSPVLAGVPGGLATPSADIAAAPIALAQDSGFHKKNKKHRHYARDQRINRDTRIWRGDDGRYYCKRDNGTTGLLIGGAVGGLAGHEIAGGGDKLLGTIIGAGAGALLGREIDRDKYRCR